MEKDTPKRTPRIAWFRAADAAPVFSADLLRGSYEITLLPDHTAAEQALMHRQTELLVLALGSADSMLLRYAAKQVSLSGPGILVLMPEVLLSEQQRYTESGVFFLPDSAPAAVVVQTLRNLLGLFRMERNVRSSIGQLQTELAELKLIQRAKLLLMKNLHMTEQQAHHYIEKTAMDTCVKRREVAETILRTYEI